MVASAGSVTAWVHRALALLGPAYCPCCLEPIDALAHLCAACLRQIAPASATVVELPVRAAGAYRDPLASAVRHLKYDPRPDLARPLGALMGAALDGIPPVSLVVPVPLHPRRLVARGFNQSALLARCVARAVGARFAPRALARTRDTTAQAGLPAAERAPNVRGAFVPLQPERLRGAEVLLVDDVVTTGATVAACAEAVRVARGRVVAVAAVAIAG